MHESWLKTRIGIIVQVAGVINNFFFFIFSLEFVVLYNLIAVLHK